MTFNRATVCASAFALAAAAGLCAAPALGADMSTSTSAQTPNARFDALDKNKDGLLTRDEAKDVHGFGAAFDAADANKDGKLDRDEFIKAESIHDRMVAGKYVDDSVLTARVKTALLTAPELKSLDVSVQTQDGVVLLSGFVHDEGQRQKAVKAARGVSGVSSVKDAMVVR